MCSDKFKNTKNKHTNRKMSNIKLYKIKNGLISDMLLKFGLLWTVVCLYAVGPGQGRR